MKREGFVRFAWWYVRKDLFAPSAKSTTWTCIWAIAGSVALIGLPAGLLLGVKAASLEALNRDVLSRGLTVTGKLEFQGGGELPVQIDERFLADLNQQLASASAQAGIVIPTSHRRRGVIYDFPSSRQNPLFGLTFRPDDPIRDARPLRGAARGAPRDRGVILTPRFLEQCGGQAPGATVKVRFGDMVHEVEVLGVTIENLPGSTYSFLIDEETDHEWNTVEEQRYSAFYSGVAPPNWPEPESETFPQEAKRFADEHFFTVEALPYPKVWRLSFTGATRNLPRPTRRDWASLLSGLTDTMSRDRKADFEPARSDVFRKGSHKAGGPLADLKAADVLVAREDLRPYDSAFVLAATIDDLKTVAEVWVVAQIYW